MRTPMQDQGRGSAEFLVAIRTLDGLAGVQRLVGFEGGFLRKGFRAEFAFVWFRTGVGAHMAFEGVRMGETEAAFVAVIWSLAGVRSAMAAQTDFGEEAFVCGASGGSKVIQICVDLKIRRKTNHTGHRRRFALAANGSTRECDIVGLW